MKQDQKAFVFPNKVEIEILFEPSSQFGNAVKNGRTVRQGSKAHFVYDANTGRTWISSDPSLKPLDTTVEWKNLKLQLKGNKITGKVKCNTRKDLIELLETLHYTLPFLLNLEFAEPPIVRYTKGKIGDAEFTWELEEKNALFDVTNEDVQEKRVLDSFLRINQLTSRRLLAATNYFYVARRLSEAGNSPFEFMAETVLNLCKVLQVLFGESRDKVRHELLKCGYSKDGIEKKFIPLMVLRTEFDVGHVSLTIFKQKQLNALYKFLDNAELNFKELLKRVFEKAKNKEYSIETDPDLHLKGDKLKRTNKLLAIFKSL